MQSGAQALPLIGRVGESVEEADVILGRGSVDVADSGNIFGAEDVKRTLQSKSDRQGGTPTSSYVSSSMNPASPRSAPSTYRDASALRKAQALSRTLLSLCRCARCDQPVMEPVTLPCGHTSCLACVLVTTSAFSQPSGDRAVPCSTHLPPRLPLSSTTIPCSSSGCTRSAIGRGLGAWSGHNAVYGPTVKAESFCSDEGVGGAGSVPVDGFVGPENQESNRLVVIPAQRKSSFSSKYAISRYNLQSCSVEEEAGLLRPDVTLTKAVELLRKYAQSTLERASPISPLRRRMTSYSSTVEFSSRQRRSRRRRGPPRQTMHSTDQSLHHPAGTRTEINPHFLPALGVSEEGRETGAEGGVRATWDSSDEDSDSYEKQGAYDRDDYSGYQEDTDPDVVQEFEDDEIGGAYARQCTPILQDNARAASLQKVKTTSNLLTPATLQEEMLDVLECQLCYMLLYQPLTTPCGHTFCRTCFARSLDHSSACPLCRAEMPSFGFFQAHPPNKLILALLTAEWEQRQDDAGHFEMLESGVSVEQLGGTKALGLKQLYADRQATMEKEARESLLSTPLFVCTLAFPHMPTILHIFEPRYRLMIRRCLESGYARFGMVLHSQDTTGPVPGMSRYGTMLEIKTVQMLPDGRSMIETVGSHRFRVLEKGSLDGYTIGQIEKIDDVSPEAEDHLERASLGMVDADAPSSILSEAREAQAAFQAAIGVDLSRGEDQAQQQAALIATIGQRTTAQLVEVCMSFVETLQSGSAPWLMTRLNNTYGPMPDASNVAAFGYWMALVMPIDEHEKAKLLPIRSARLRLRIVVHWIEQLRQTWWFNNGCSVQ